MKEDRKILITFTVFAVFILAFGFFRLRESIVGPFRLSKIATAQLTEEDLYQILSQRDTDGDGLSDWEEIFIYGTSPFLVDTDGDGFTDYEEVMAGSDPLDPESTPLNPHPERPRPIYRVAESTDQEIDQNVYDFSPENIRNVLIDVGVDKKILDNIDDETLKKLYYETVEETGIPLIEIMEEQKHDFGRLDFSKIFAEAQEMSKKIDTEELGGDQITTEQLFLEETIDFENLEPAIIRQLMIESGAEPAILDQIDDQTLMMLFLQAFQEAQKLK